MTSETRQGAVQKGQMAPEDMWRERDFTRRETKKRHTDFRIGLEKRAKGGVLENLYNPPATSALLGKTQEGEKREQKASGASERKELTSGSARLNKAQREHVSMEKSHRRRTDSD